MAHREPVNIQRLRRQNETYAKAEEYCKTVTTGSVVSKWHERSFVHGTRSNTFKGETLGFTGHQRARSAVPTKLGAKGNMLEQETALAKKASLEDRRARLKELYREEALQYDKELNDLGLAMARDWS